MSQWTRLTIKALPARRRHMAGHAQVVTMLLAANVDVDQEVKNDEDVTSLFLACQEGHTDVVTTLLAAGIGG